MTHILAGNGTIIDRFVAELRDVNIQGDRMRFRRNLERIGEVSAYELSRHLNWEATTVTTPLGEADTFRLKDRPVLATILRAGLPLHQGLLNYFDDADNAFISAYRTDHREDGSFDVRVEYLSSPNIEGRTVILSDPMLATGMSMVLAYRALLRKGDPAHVHIVAAIASRQGIAYLEKHLPGNCTLWLGAVDEELTAHSYIVPGLGDAGDLAFGIKE
ncbi:MAG: uracil phosphoribosyltransferase [Flavobacteriales bacterium]|nr:uracil phosphoribosyltransferase [Flavobacteriales bacterium]